MLPAAQREYFTALWQEYEDGESADARFALVLDRTMPMLMNLHNEGQSWVENGISLEQVLSRNAIIAEVHRSCGSTCCNTCRTHSAKAG